MDFRAHTTRMNRIRSYLCIAAVLFFSVPSPSAQSPVGSTTKERIIRAERPSIADDDEKPVIQVVEVLVNKKRVDLNKPFLAGDDWLESLQIRVRNIGNRNLSCIGISFGVLAELDTKLKPSESWPWGLALFRGKCGRFTRDHILSLKPGTEIVLGSTDTPTFYGITEKEGANLAKAVLHWYGQVGFGGKKLVEIPIELPASTYFLTEPAY